MKQILITEVNSKGAGWGVSGSTGQATIIPFSLPGDVFELMEDGERVGRGHVPKHQIIKTSPHRQEPPCSAFPSCSGCTFMHATPAWQISFKEEWVRSLLSEVASEAVWEVPLQGATTKYRRKARLRARWDNKSGIQFIGFKNRYGKYIADVSLCQVLAPPFDELILPLRTLLGSLDARASIPQLELAIGDDDAVMIVRHLVPLEEGDRGRLENFEREAGIRIFVQPGGHDTVQPLVPRDSSFLSYSLPTFGLTFRFEPLDFIQAHGSLNEALVSCAIEWMAPQKHETILDLFCGLGNFSLPLAMGAQSVVGVEGSTTMAERAQANADSNTIGNTAFFAVDLEKDISGESWAHRSYAGLLLDPPRSGAAGIVSQIERFAPQRIVYVSCNPTTLARDAVTLREKGYRLTRVRVADMFPHTEHVEAIGLFERSTSA